MAKKLLIAVVVLSAFQDKIDHKTQYPVGTELQVDEERAKDLVSRGLAKIKEATPAKETDKQKKEVKEKKAAEEADKAEKPEAKDAATLPADDNPETKTEDEHQGTEE